MNTLPTIGDSDSSVSSTTDDYWIDHYPSISRKLQSQASPTTPLSPPPPPPPPSNNSLALRKQLASIPPLPEIAISYSNPITVPETPDHHNKNTTSIYPTEILSPTPSRSSDIESRLKSVRFAHTTYHAPQFPGSDYIYFTSATANIHTRARSNSETERHLEELGLRPISDPVAGNSRTLPLRGDIPRRMSSRSRSQSGKRVDREGRNESRGRDFERMSEREYIPLNRPIRPAPRDLPHILHQQSTLLLSAFTTTDAYALGTALHTRLLTHPSPATISISLASGLVLFHCTTKPGATLDSAALAERKRLTVLRFEVSTWYLERKYGGDEGAWERRCEEEGVGVGVGVVIGGGGGLGGIRGEGKGVRESGKARFSCVGGGLPLRVSGVEGVVAVVVVCGLGGEENHEVIVETIQENWY